MESFLPGHDRDASGELRVGGFRVSDLAITYGTPTLFLDLSVIDEAIDVLQAACKPHGVRIAYAGKALLVTALARHLVSRGLNIDACSLGELATLERAQVPPGRITLHGAGKSDEEMRAALAGRVGRLIIDSLGELRRLATFPHAPLDVALRLNTGIEAHTHEFVRTAGDDSKFGIAPREEIEAMEVLRKYPHLRLNALHSHIGSQIYESAPFAANAEYLMEATERFTHAGFGIETLIAGGGFGIQTHPEAEDETIDWARTISCMVEAARIVANARGLTLPQFEIEPGRAIVGSAGTSLYRVLAIKRFQKRTFVIVDGSMADNPRPALYGAHHHVLLARQREGERQPVTICGRSCENDELGTATLPIALQEGDLLAMCSTGAYTYSMASSYNRFARPPIVALENGRARLFATRESLEDVLRSDVDA